MAVKNKLYTFETLFTEGVDNKVISRIVIPKIQRAYAQGRKEEYLVRDAILEDIFDALANSKDIEFSFIYGSLVACGNGFDFELLDGQQRMTTIFLLYLYLSIREHGDVEDWMKGCFTYETRTTSTDFIHKLVQLTEIVSDEKKTPSQYIESKIWFTNAYKMDSTVTSMLTMLDSIHQKYEDLDCTDIVGKLKHLKFYVLPLDKFGLTEELYIKMNARGLQLTPFENFKADLVGYYKPKGDLNDPKVMDEYKSWLEFSTKLDTTWIDLFWSKEDNGDKEFNDKYFRFFYRYCAVMLYMKYEKDQDAKSFVKDKLLKFFEEKSEVQNDKKYLGFDNYRLLLNGGIEIKEDVTKILNTIQDKSDLINEQLVSQWGERMELYGIVDSYTRRTAIVNAAIILYILNYDTFDDENFRKWMRVVWNIVENTDINSVIPQVNTVRNLNEILVSDREVGNIYKTLSSKFRDKGKPQAIREEARKAQFIEDNPREDWEHEFKELEKHPFFKGYVDVVITDGMKLVVLKNRIQGIVPMFDANGISSAYRKKHILLRAMIASVNRWVGGLSNLSITERIDSDKHLKGLLHRGDIQKMLCEVLDNSLNLQDVIDNRQFDHCTDNGFANPKLLDVAYKRLCTDEKLLNWVTDHCSNSKCVVIKSRDWEHIKVRVPKAWYDKVYIDNKLNKYIPQLEKDKGFDYDNSDQKTSFEEYGYYWDDCVWMRKEIDKYILWVKYDYTEYVGFWVSYRNGTQKNKIIEVWNITDKDNIDTGNKMVYIDGCKAKDALSKVDEIIAKLETL